MRREHLEKALNLLADKWAHRPGTAEGKLWTHRQERAAGREPAFGRDVAAELYELLADEEGVMA